jgi:hypothetical protein
VGIGHGRIRGPKILGYFALTIGTLRGLALQLNAFAQRRVAKRGQPAEGLCWSWSSVMCSKNVFYGHVQSHMPIKVVFIDESQKDNASF